MRARPSIATARGALAEALAVAALAVLVGAATWALQPPIAFNGGKGFDGTFYVAMAQAQRTGQAQSVAAPYAYRVAVPFVAAHLPLENPLAAFLAVDLVACGAIAVLMTLWLRRFRLSPPTRCVLHLLFWTSWLSPVRWSIYYPALTDATGGAFALGLLLAAPSRRSTFARDLAFTALAVAAPAVRESLGVFVLAPAVPLILDPARRRELLKLVPALAGAAAVWIGIHVAVVPAASPGFVAQASRFVFEKGVPVLLAAGFAAFGPLAVLVWHTRRYQVKLLRVRPDFAWILAAHALGAWIGGADTERILSWALPVYLVMLGKALDRCAWTRLPVRPIALALSVAQLLCWRAFWATPAQLASATPAPFPLYSPPGSAFGLVELSALTAGRAVVLAAAVEHAVTFLVAALALVLVRAGRRAVPDAEPAPEPAAARRLPAALVLIGVGCAAHVAALTGPFYMDDEFRVSANRGIRQVFPLSRHFTDARTMAGVNFMVGYRPLLPLSFSLNYAVAGLEPWIYHLNNLVILILTAIVLQRVALMLFARDGGVPVDRRGVAALVAALLFVVHPLGGTTVNYVSNRDAGLMFLFLVCAVWAHLRARAPAGGPRARLAFHVLAVAFATLAMLSKQNALVLPALVMALELIVLGGRLASWATWRRVLPFVLVVGGYFAFTHFVLNMRDLANVRSEDQTPAQYLRQQLKIHVTEYAAALPFPVKIRALPDIPRVESVLDPGCVAGLVFLLGSLALAFRWRRRRRLVAFCIASYWVLMAVESSVLPLARPAAHYRAYPSSAFAFVALTALFAERVDARRLLRASLLPAAYFIAVSVWSASLWRTPLWLWAHSIAYGAEPIAYENMASVMLDQDPKDQRAWYLLAAARRADPLNASIVFKCGMAVVLSGEQVQDGLNECESVIRRCPEYTPAYFGLATLYMDLGRTEDAWRTIQRGVELEPDNLRFRVLAVVVAEKAGRHADCDRQFAEAVRLGCAGWPDAAAAHARSLAARQRPLEAAPAPFGAQPPR